MAAEYITLDRSNVVEHYFKVVQEIRDADFIALGTEFTGRKVNHDYLPDVSEVSTNQEIYSNYSITCKHYQMLQLGISTFKWDAQQKIYKERSLSIYMHPGGEESVSYDTSTLRFLANNNFDFKRCYTLGLPPCQLQTVVGQAKWEELVACDDPYKFIIQTVKHTAEREKVLAGIEKKKVHSKKVILEGEQVFKSVREWQPTQNKELKIPILKGTWDYLNEAKWIDFIKSMGASAGLKKKDAEYTIEIKRKTPKDSVTSKTTATESVESSEMSEKLSEEGSDSKSVQSDEGIKRESTIEPQLEELLETCATSMLILEIIRSKKKLIAHCSLYDFMYLYQNTIGELPPKLSEFSTALGFCFPELYDSKHLFQAAKPLDSQLPQSLADAFYYLKKHPLAEVLLQRPEFKKSMPHDAG